MFAQQLTFHLTPECQLLTFNYIGKIISVSPVNACYVISSGCVKSVVFSDGSGRKNSAKLEFAIDDDWWKRETIAGMESCVR